MTSKITSLDFVLTGPELSPTVEESNTVDCGITLRKASPAKNDELVYRGTRIKLPCQHVFDKDAIQRWYLISNDPKCPCCTKPIAGRDVRLVPKTPQEDSKALRRQTAITQAAVAETHLALQQNRSSASTSVFLMSNNGIKEMRFSLSSRTIVFKG